MGCSCRGGASLAPRKYRLTRPNGVTSDFDHRWQVEQARREAGGGEITRVKGRATENQ